MRFAFSLRALGLILAAVALYALTYFLGPIVPALAVLAFIGWGIVSAATRVKRQPWMHAGLPVLLLAVLLLPAMAFAADGIVIPYGDWIGALLPVIAGGLMALASWALRFLPANIIALFGNGRVELLLSNAINYSLNAVAGAAKGRTLSADLGNKVLNEAMQYAIDNASPWLLSWAGGPEGLAKKIWGRLDLEPAADSAPVELVATSAQVK